MKTSEKLLKGMCIMMICLLSYQGNSQPWYGQIRYPHDSTILSSAKRTFNDTGFIMAGFRSIRHNVSTNTSPDFVIDKVSPNGTFSSPPDFSKKYQILADPINCTSPSPVYNCMGVTIIETTNQGSGEAYAIAGAYQKGVFFATLSLNGTVINRRFWAFPNGSFANKKPSLRESKINPGKYYICGSCGGTSYVMKVAANGAQIWGNIYTATQTEARDLIESPYNSNELIVVGRTDVTFPVSSADAFFMSLNATTGVVNVFQNYTFLSWDSDDWFASIDLANSATGGQGYVLGGRAFGPTAAPPSPANNARYTQWMCKLDASGNVVWSTLIKPGAFVYNAVEGNEVDRVYERLNPNIGSYEYYGVAASYYTVVEDGSIQPLNNLVVYKLTDVGGINSTQKNEFHYVAGSTAPPGATCAYADLTGIQSKKPGDGFQAFGTDPSPAVQSHFFIRSYFNGEAGCYDTIINIDSVFTGPHLVGPQSIGVNAFQQCGLSGGSLVVTSVSPNLNKLCYASTLSTGSNARQMVGIEALSEETNQMSLYPNPVKDRVTLAVPAYIKDRVAIAIFNNLGQKIQEYNYANTDNGEFVIDFNSLGVKGGFYTVQVSAGSLKNTYKVIYEK